MRVTEVPHRYVASEESALARFLTRGDARPTMKPPLPAQRGVHGRPTLVDNVETLAHLALIARFGAEWYRGCGTAAAPGTTLVTVGRRRDGHRGVRDRVRDAAGVGALDGRAVRRRPRAPSSSAVWAAPGSPRPCADVAFTPEDLRTAGAAGGGVAALAVAAAPGLRSRRDRPRRALPRGRVRGDSAGRACSGSPPSRTT